MKKEDVVCKLSTKKLKDIVEEIHSKTEFKVNKTNKKDVDSLVNLGFVKLNGDKVERLWDKKETMVSSRQHNYLTIYKIYKAGYDIGLNQEEIIRAINRKIPELNFYGLLDVMAYLINFKETASDEVEFYVNDYIENHNKETLTSYCRLKNLDRRMLKRLSKRVSDRKKNG
jgi:hypothetical protein